ncbi:MAG: ATP-dependent Clp protease ATP-binding subunit, partial [Oscillospiraceae bacterium]|nr:ATP-dependent Clp protease ATP-binding subunit [Oscillospiraceae bacterium]
MQPTLCSKCKKRMAVVFISRLENGENVNSGLCLKCAKELGIPQVDEIMRRMGINDEDLEMINEEMMQALGGVESMEGMIPGQSDDEDIDDGEDGKTATFPFLNRLFGGNTTPPPAPTGEPPRSSENNTKDRKADKTPKRKYLDSYCINLTERARSGKLDNLIGREQEIERVIQILNRRQKNNPCLIGEPGVGKTAIAEGLAQRIAKGDVPFKLRD